MDVRALEFASQSVKNDKNFILTLISQDKLGVVLKHVGSELLKDRGVVLEAVKSCGTALRFASEELRGDREIVQAAVKNSFHALVFLLSLVVCSLSFLLLPLSFSH